MAENADRDPRTALAGARTNLALLRTSLALDRTTLAWIRTALTFTTFGLGMIGFFRTMEQVIHSPEAVRLHQLAIHVGVVLLVIGTLATILTAFTHWRALGRLRRGEHLSVARWPLAITAAVLIALLELYVLWSAFAP